MLFSFRTGDDRRRRPRALRQAAERFTLSRTDADSERPQNNGSTVRINLLESTVTGRDVVTTIGGRELELAICIGVRDRPVARETLVAEIWPQADDTACISLDVTLHRLRKRLGQRESICRTTYGYCFAQHVTTDFALLTAFDRALRAQTDVSRPEMDALVAAHRRLIAAQLPNRIAATIAGEMLEEKLRSLRARFAHRLAAFALDSRQPARALEIAQGTLRADACDEAACELAIRASLALHDRAGAIETLRTYTRNLARELGLQPSRSLTEIIRAATVLSVRSA